jgi:hypothetical protein
VITEGGATAAGRRWAGAADGGTGSDGAGDAGGVGGVLNDGHGVDRERRPLVRSVAETLRAKKYIQSHTIDTPLNTELVKSRGITDYFDGIAEAWWDSLEDLASAATAPEAQQAIQALAEDEAKFIDIAESTNFVTEEHVILISQADYPRMRRQT